MGNSEIPSQSAEPNTDQLMSQLVDIGMPNLGYRHINPTKLQKKGIEYEWLSEILEHGVLGAPDWWSGERRNITYFNITTRGFHEFPFNGVNDSADKKPNEEIMKASCYSQSNIAVLFSLDGLKEDEPWLATSNSRIEVNLPKNIFKAELRWEAEEHFLKTGEIKPHSNYGFIMRPPILQQNLVGVATSEAIEEDEDSIESIVSSMRSACHFLPIYGADGSLVWPQRIPYEDVQKMTASK